MKNRRSWYLLLTAYPLLAQGPCANVQLQLAPDYSFATGSSNGGNAYTFTIGGQTLAQGSLTQLALFHYDSFLAGTAGNVPAQSVGTSFVPGKWGSALSIATGGILSYPSAGKVSFSDGTIELWIAPTKSGTDPVYSQYAHTLFRYAAVNGDALIVSEASGGGLIAGTLVGGKFTGWGFPLGQMSPWKAGDWHHVAFTYSVAQGRIRLYLDGTLGFGNDTSSIPMPGSNGASFTIDSDPSGHASAFLVDELRISSDEKSAAQIHYDATRSTPFADNEVMLPLVGISPGSLNYSVGGCGSATYNYVGVPITNLTPAEGLLSAGSTSVRIAFNTVQSTTCRYSLGSADDYASMLTLDTGPPSAAHQGVLNGLSSDPRVVNRVYLRCASNPDYLRTLTYRTVAPPGQAFPRIGTIWTGWYLYQNASDLAKKNQLFLSTSPLTPLDITQLRAANPGFLGITEVNVSVFDAGFSPPEDYYLKDIHGNKIISWCAPALYLANTTKPEVAQALARQAYQQLVDSNFVYDGLFFDSFNTTISQPFTDCHGNAVEIDSNGDGIADDPAILNAAWKAGMYSVINAFRSLAPNAYVSGHVLATPAQPESLAAFNGTSLLGSTETVKEGLIPFGDLWDLYQTWESQGVWPTMTMIQSCPPNLLSYGYGYQPLNQNHMLPSTMAFAQSSYPNMRFGLGLSLMGDGFFGFDTGDSASQIAWWYDEYDFNLGYPLGPAVQTGAGSSANLMANGGFEAGLSQWQLTVANGKATLAVDTSIAAEGSASAHINVVSAGAANSVRLVQDKAAWSAGVEYRIQFWARADAPRTITVSSVGSGPKSAAPIAIGTSWGFYSLSFTALTTPQIGRLEFWVGDIAGNIWIDDVRLVQEPSLVYRRDFTNGVVLLNGSATPQTVTLEAGLRRFKGTQAPLYQYMLDDADGAFSATGSWKTVTYNTGSWGPAKKNLPPAPQNQNGPYYHCWEGTCHQLDSGASPAQWNLNTPADGQYTIQAWLPAAPGAASWTKSAVYEVVAGGHVVASATIDQSTASAGDALHAIATVNLTAADAPFLRVHNEGTGALIADAVYVTSAALYNDGSSAPQVTLGGFDSILLQRQQPLPATTSRVNSVVHAATFQPSISSGGFVAISGTGFGSSPRTWASSDFSGTSLPSSLGGVSATINGKPAYVEYISPTQINVIAPDDDTVGQVQVQVTTPQGANYTGTVLKQKLSPGLFTYQAGTTNYAAAVHPDGTFVGPTGPSSRPAAPGEVIAIYGTGFGATTPAAPSAQLVSQAAPTVLPVTIMIGGVTAEVQWAGLVSSGLYQINVKIPELAAGDRPIQATIGGFQSPPTVMLPSASP